MRLSFKLIIVLLISSFSLSGQSYDNPKKHEFSYRDSNELYRLGLDINNKTYDNLKLRYILSVHKRSKLNNVFGTVFRTGAYIFGGFGALLLASAPSQDTGMGQGLSVLFGASFVSIGAIGYGISVPFKMASKRRGFERDIMIQKLNEKNTGKSKTKSKL
ncbi:MAG: hypothetical protein P8L24_00830 [Cytophagales bacterium]|nr:hypothetical protein [Cytophagales bacterium]